MVTDYMRCFDYVVCLRERCRTQRMLRVNKNKLEISTRQQKVASMQAVRHLESQIQETGLVVVNFLLNVGCYKSTDC